ncbi:hypothetical protein FHR76_001611 [Rhizobium sp. RAS22]|nr:hypothetical protein [Rhizobium sp. RAS22]
MAKVDKASVEAILNTPHRRLSHDEYIELRKHAESVSSAISKAPSSPQPFLTQDMLASLEANNHLNRPEMRKAKKR